MTAFPMDTCLAISAVAAVVGGAALVSTILTELRYRRAREAFERALRERLQELAHRCDLLALRGWHGPGSRALAEMYPEDEDAKQGEDTPA